MTIELSREEAKAVQYAIDMAYLNLFQRERETLDKLYVKINLAKFQECVVEAV